MIRILVALCLLMPSCASYYDAQKAYYEAQTAIASRPMAEMTAPDGTRFMVNNHNLMIRSAQNPFVETINAVVSSPIASILSGGWATREIVRAATGDNNSTWTQTTDNSAVATPTVVMQPDPMVVEQPKPMVINQPEPIIVKQPETIVINKE